MVGVDHCLTPACQVEEILKRPQAGREGNSPAPKLKKTEHVQLYVHGVLVYTNDYIYIYNYEHIHIYIYIYTHIFYVHVCAHVSFFCCGLGAC